jgi:RNA polymerase subunit RPABC4/transcription elongation factor Spt4
MSRLREELKLIPSAAWALAAVFALGAPALYWMLVFTPTDHRVPFHLFPLLPLGVAAVFFSIYILLVGYVASDARRRGMPVLLWVLLAIFVPSGIGIILYFILRRPLLHACPKCHSLVDATFAYCTSCGMSMTKSCPSCRRSVHEDWSHCPKCGATLQPA